MRLPLSHAWGGTDTICSTLCPQPPAFLGLCPCQAGSPGTTQSLLLRAHHCEASLARDLPGNGRQLPPHWAVHASRTCSPIPRAPATDFLFRRKDFREQRAGPPPPEAFFVTCPRHCRFCRFRHEQESTEPWQSSKVQQPHVPAAQGKQQGLGQGSRAEPAQLWVLGASAVTWGLLALPLLMLLARQERQGASRAQTQVSLPPPVWHLSLIRIIIGLLQMGLLGLLARPAHQPDKSL